MSVPPENPGIVRDETGTQRTLGYEFDLGGGDGRARCRLTVDDRHTNRIGMFHGGLLAVMLDNAMGGAASLSVDASGMSPIVTVSMNTSFLGMAKVGDRLTAEAWVTGGGRSLKFVAAEVRDQDDRLIGTGTGVFKSTPDRKSSEPR